ncbi:MAG: autotransporter outer membrane beta-barrel domain-containing protein [Fusobacteriaceae bacterium]|nr:autotransporter outer membrane beta-barrel domain-containing protein [Fusobacteriaceae bacterium]
MHRKWMKERDGREETRLGKKVAVLSFLAAAMLSGTAKADPVVIDEEWNTDVRGNTDTGTPSNNEVNIGENAKIKGTVWGGRSTSPGAEIQNNAVTVTGGQMTYVYGGWATDGTAHDNTVRITGGEMGTIQGGAGIYGSSHNTVSIENAKAVAVYGGRTCWGDFTENTVEIKSGAFSGPIVGATQYKSSNGSQANSWAHAINNGVTIHGGTFGASIYGASVTRGFASDNSVTITGGNVQNQVAGNYTGIIGAYVRESEPDATGPDKVERNSVKISGSETRIDVTNSVGTGSIIGGKTDEAGAMKNEVSITGVNDKGSVKANYIYGAYAAGDVLENKVTIEDSSVEGKIIGAESTAGSAKDNHVSVVGPARLSGDVYGARGYSGEVTGNSVTLSGDTEITGSLYGGYADDGNAEYNSVRLEGTNGKIIEIGDVEGGSSVKGDAKNNSVYLKGDFHVAGSLIGGSVCDGEASGNLVSLEGNIRIDADLVGGFSIQGLSADNTLEIKSENIQVGGLYGFQNLHFYFSESVRNGAVMIKAENNASNEVDITGSQAKIFFSGDQTPLNAGERVILIDTEGGLTGDPITDDNRQITARLGVSLDYDFILSYDDNEDKKQLIASLLKVSDSGSGEQDPNPTPDPGLTPDPDPTPDPELPDPDDPKEPSHDPEPAPAVRVNPQMKAFSEGYLAGMTYLRRAGDLLAGSGSAAMAEALAVDSDRIGWTPFVIGGGNSMTHKTGSSVRTQGTALLAGLAVGKEGKSGLQAIGGAFLEGGRGHYSTDNSFANAAAVEGKGKSDYVGGGLMGRLNLPSRTSAHAYLQGSLRGGRIRINYDSRTLKDALGQVAAYRTKSAYSGAHAGLGCAVELSDKTTLDLRADYLWTRMSGADVRLTTGDPIKFKAVNSNRIRIGGRLTTDGGAVKPYAGLAFEHEFAGTSRAVTNGHKITAPSLKGNTIVGEAGFRITPEKAPLTVDLGIQVHGGKRHGVTGDVRFTYKL